MYFHRARITIIALSIIMSIRMLGLFMILPVFSTSATLIFNATPALLGFALGIYGLTQAIFQIPLGMLSDQIGRKPVILGGLSLLLMGSVIAALAHSIHMLSLGRALQGAGAIGSTVLALAADLTSDSARSKAMALIGFAVGLAFTLSLIIGPILNAWFQLSGIFWTTAILAMLAIALAITTIPAPWVYRPVTTKSMRQRLWMVLTNVDLLRLNLGIFSLHAILTALFLALPMILSHKMQLNEWHQASLYFIVLIISFVLAISLIILAEKKQQTKTVFLGAITVIIVTQLLFVWFYQYFNATTILLVIFFTAFTFLEATLPAFISKIAPAQYKGTAMGVYSSSQFLGIFIGGVLSGWVLTYADLPGVFLLCICIGFIWLASAIFMENELRNVVKPGNLPEIE